MCRGWSGYLSAVLVVAIKMNGGKLRNNGELDTRPLVRALLEGGVVISRRNHRELGGLLLSPHVRQPRRSRWRHSMGWAQTFDKRPPRQASTAPRWHPSLGYSTGWKMWKPPPNKRVIIMRHTLPFCNKVPPFLVPLAAKERYLYLRLWFSPACTRTLRLGEMIDTHRK